MTAPIERSVRGFASWPAKLDTMSSNSRPALDSMSSASRRILDAGLALVLRKGGADVTMAEIAEAAGISRQAVYLNFPGRSAFLLALFRYVDESRGLEVELQRVL